jgi:hypothetical protein
MRPGFLRHVHLALAAAEYVLDLLVDAFYFQRAHDVTAFPGFVLIDPVAVAVLNALDRLVDGYDSQLGSARRELNVSRDQLRDFQGRIGKTFEHAAYKDELTELRDRLRLGLSDKASAEDKAAVSEIAERINALRASNAVEAAPARVGTRRTVRAERPVTSRIMERRASAEPVELPKIVKPVSEPVAEVITMPEPVKPKPVDSMPVNGYRQAVTRRRLENEAHLRLF